MKIHNLTQIAPQMLDKGIAKPEQGQGDDFANQLMDVLKEVNASQNNAEQMKTDLQTGQPVEFHDVMIAMEKASLAMNLTLAVRNKALEAYQELMRTQV